MPDTRRAQVVAAAGDLLEAEGWDAVSMRRIADSLGIRAPSLYKHLRSKEDVELTLIAQGFEELADALAAAGPTLTGLAAAYRAFATGRPHRYRLMTAGPLDRERLPPGVEARAAEPLLAALGDEHRARAAWAAAHGLAILEISGRFPPGADIDAAWAAFVAAFSP
jgi:AcrR family transcriptional regulator